MKEIVTDSFSLSVAKADWINSILEKNQSVYRLTEYVPAFEFTSPVHQFLHLQPWTKFLFW